jgi:hypothetical protein
VSSAVEITDGISVDLVADRAHSVLGSSPPHASTDQPLAVSHALDMVVPRTPSETLLLPPVEAVMSTTGGAWLQTLSMSRVPWPPFDELGTVEQLVPSIDDTHAVSSIPSVNLPLILLEEGRLGAAVVPDIVPNQGIPHPVERPMFVEPQDVTINSRGGLPSHRQVYFRRRRHTKKCSEPDEPAASLNDLEKVIKPVVQLLPMPVAKKRSCKTSAAVPRRSRRVAGVKPCSPGPIIIEAQKKVIRSLGLAAKDEAFDQKAKTTTVSCSRGD